MSTSCKDQYIFESYIQFPCHFDKPFPNQKRNMVAQNPPSYSQVMILSISNKKNGVMVDIMNKDYGNMNPSIRKFYDHPYNPAQHSFVPLQIEKLEKSATELNIKPPKGIIHKSTFNPQVRATQNYNKVEDLAQIPSIVSTLKVLQRCPTTNKSLLVAIGGVYP